MLDIIVPEKEFWDESREMFLKTKPVKLTLEHSLISLSKWESKWKKPFLGKDDKTTAEVLDYVRCMTINKNVPSYAYRALTSEHVNKITEYLNDKMTATTINRNVRSNARSEIVTSEVIYYWMILNGIPFECEKWNLNRLLTLIEVCEIKNGGTKKMPRGDIIRQNAALNAARRAKLNSRG